MIMQMNESGPDEPESDKTHHPESPDAATSPSVTYGFVPLHPGLHYARRDAAHPISEILQRRPSRPRTSSASTEECGSGLFFG